MNDKTKIVIKKYSVPLVAFLIFILPMINSALQIDLATKSTIPLHWQMVISAAIGGGISTIVTVIKKIYENAAVELEKTIANLTNDLEKEKLNRDLSEKNIMLNSAYFNEKWLKSNVGIDQLEAILMDLKATKEANHV